MHGRRKYTRRQNPYDLGRGEIPVSVQQTKDGTFLLTSKRVYMLFRSGEPIDGKWTDTSKFQPVIIDRPKLREAT